MRPWFAALAVLLAAPALSAAPSGPLVSKGSEWSYLVHKGPLAPKRIGPVALAGLDAAAEPTKRVPSALGDSAPRPPGWPSTDVRGPKGAAPLGTRGSKRCKRCNTTIADGRRERGVVIYASRKFEVEDPGALTSIEIRMLYRDGIVVNINGREVARRNIDRDSGELALARRKRGSEWESVFLAAVPGLLQRGSNLITVEVRPSGHRAGPDFDLEVLGHRGPRLVRGPVVQRSAKGLPIIRFSTDIPTTAVVEWGTSSELGRRSASRGGALAVHHRVELAAAPAGKGIYYRVRAGGLTTAARALGAWPDKGTVRFAVYGDMRGGHRVHRKITQAIASEAPDFVVVTGDLVVRGSDGGDWQRFFEVAGELLAGIPYFPVAGNHDMGRSGDERRLMSELFELPAPPPKRPAWGNWYSFDVAGVHMVMLDSNSYKNADQRRWLEEDLRAARKAGARAIIAAVHDGPYSRGIHRGSRYAQAVYVPILIKYKVDMIFAGHDHLYQRGEVGGLRYVVSGGGGAPLYPIRCGRKGKRRCKVADGMKFIESTYHYLTVTVRKRHLELCAKRPDRSPVEPCVSMRLRR